MDVPRLTAIALAASLLYQNTGSRALAQSALDPAMQRKDNPHLPSYQGIVVDPPYQTMYVDENIGKKSIASVRASINARRKRAVIGHPGVMVGSGAIR